MSEDGAERTDHDGVGADPLRGSDRRAIPQRSASWAKRLATAMRRVGLTPNLISVGSVLVAAVGAAALVVGAVVPDGPRTALLILAAVCMPLRLLLNMLDGMLAVEEGMHTATGDLFNEVPDRIADLLLIGAAGCATAGIATAGRLDLGVLAGFVAAALAVLTAYVRTLGAANNVGNFFNGPLPKPHRMWLLMAATVLSTFEPLVGIERGTVLFVGVLLIAAGSLITVVLRLRRIAAAMTARQEVAR